MFLDVPIIIDNYSSVEHLGTSMNNASGYTARVVQNPGRQGLAVEFRHPQKYRRGRPGKKVRRGLDTTDRAEADKLVEEINVLLSDESLHSYGQKTHAAAR
jgi:hypothetical protein